MTLYEVLKNTAQKKPRSTAIAFYGWRCSYFRLVRLVDCMGAGLKQRGIKQGDVVTLCLPNTPSALIAFYALNKIGAIVNLVHPKTPPLQLSAALKKTGSVMLIIFDLYSGNGAIDFNGAILTSRCNYFMGLAARVFFRLKNKPPANIDCLEQLLKSKPDTGFASFAQNDAAVFLPSGGTTGSPKIVVHNNKVFIDLCNHLPFFLSGKKESYTAMYTVLPIFHGFGLCMNMLLCVHEGYKNVMSIRFDPKHIARSIKKEGISILMGVPSMFKKLIKSRHFCTADLSALKDCFVGGDSVPTSVVNEFNDILHSQGSNACLHVGYGLTEVVAVCAVNNSRLGRIGSVGTALPDCSVRIFSNDGAVLKNGQIGEIGICSPITMLGYLDGESPIRAIDGKNWLFTGDLGYLDDDGFLFFKQRAKNMIKVSAIPVFPSEVEEAALCVKGVAAAAAIGVVDQSAGEAVKLFVEPCSFGADQNELRQQILDQCTKSLICYAVPKSIVFVKSLPVNNMGKIDIASLRQNV